MADTTKVLDMINNASQMVKDAVEKVNKCLMFGINS